MQKIPTWLVGRFEVDPRTECWLWTGNILANGYGQIYVSGIGPLSAHRLAYEDMVEPIPCGHHIDHVFSTGCRFKHCVRPDHLEAVTPQENTRRHHALSLVCPNGHPRKGAGRCQRCRREAHKRWVRANPERFKQLVKESRERMRECRK